MSPSYHPKTKEAWTVQNFSTGPLHTQTDLKTIKAHIRHLLANMEAPVYSHPSFSNTTRQLRVNWVTASELDSDALTYNVALMEFF